MDRYKFGTLIGTVIMGIGFFIGCLAEDPLFINLGNELLIASIFVIIYGYSK